MVVLLFDVSFTHRIIAKRQLKLLNDLRLSITKLLAKFDAISLFYADDVNENSGSVHCTSVL